jgi:hypothetical protein
MVFEDIYIDFVLIELPVSLGWGRKLQRNNMDRTETATTMSLAILPLLCCLPIRFCQHRRREKSPSASIESKSGIAM